MLSFTRTRLRWIGGKNSHPNTTLTAPRSLPRSLSEMPSGWSNLCADKCALCGRQIAVVEVRKRQAQPEVVPRLAIRSDGGAHQPSGSPRSRQPPALARREWSACGSLPKAGWRPSFSGPDLESLGGVLDGRLVRLEIQDQTRRKPSRCQATTVSCLTMTSARDQFLTPLGQQHPKEAARLSQPRPRALALEHCQLLTRGFSLLLTSKEFSQLPRTLLSPEIHARRRLMD